MNTKKDQFVIPFDLYLLWELSYHESYLKSNIQSKTASLNIVEYNATQNNCL